MPPEHSDIRKTHCDDNSALGEHRRGFDYRNVASGIVGRTLSAGLWTELRNRERLDPSKARSRCGPDARRVGNAQAGGCSGLCSKAVARARGGHLEIFEMTRPSCSASRGSAKATEFVS